VQYSALLDNASVGVSHTPLKTRLNSTPHLCW